MRKNKINQNWIFENILKPSAPVKVELPHDAMQTEKRIPGMKDGQASGFFPGGKYQYKRIIEVSKEELEDTFILEFEGIYQKSSVFLNNEYVGGRIYGYSDFLVDITGKLLEGENELRVIADNSQTPNSRWYSGSGIYRDVYLHQGGKEYIKPSGVRVHCTSISPAILEVSVDAQCQEGTKIYTEIMYQDDVVASGYGSNIELEIDNPHLWSAKTPELYDVRVCLIREGNVIDTTRDRTGIRQITWNGQQGLMVNGTSVKLRGGCVHHDLGFLGTRSIYTAELRRARIMKENGFNAIRYAHNPAGKAFLDACDEVGIYVMDEAFDAWDGKKTDRDYGMYFKDEWERDLQSMVRVAYNHPSVIIYSIGNEIPNLGQEDGKTWTIKLRDAIHKEDKSRPLINAMNISVANMAKRGKGFNASITGPDDIVDPYEEGNNSKVSSSLLFNMMVSNMSVIAPILAKFSKPDKTMGDIAREMAPLLDLTGYNYNSGAYDAQIREMPNYVICATETYPSGVPTHWKHVMKHSNIIGEFVWTGWDYLGEVGAGLPRYGKMKKGFYYDYPGICGYCGCINLDGQLHAQGAHVAAVWKQLQQPFIGVRSPELYSKKTVYGLWRDTDAIASWTWPGLDGCKTEVQIYYDAYEMELLVNGKSRGRKKPVDARTNYEVIYEAGVLEARAYDQQGTLISSSTLETAGKESQISCTIENKEVNAANHDIAYLDFYISDLNHRIKMSKHKKLSISVEGPGELIGIGSANPLTRESYLGTTFTTYHGRVVAIIRATGDKGAIHVSAAAEGMEPVEAIVNAI